MTSLDESICIQDEKTFLLLEKVLALPKQYKGVLYLYYYEGYHVKEIAEIMKLSESNVKQRLKRGRDQLKEEVEKDERGYVSRSC